MTPLLLALLIQVPDTLPPGVDGHGRPTVTIPRMEVEATVDGRLDEPVWRQAARLTGFSQYEPVDGRPAEEQTDVLVWYAPDAIWFGIIAHDDHPEAIRATNADRDNIDSDDYVIIYLDTFNDRRRAFFFSVNPLGSQEDGVRSEGASSAGNIFGGTIDKNPDYVYESKGRITRDGYVVEVRIPFKSLRYPGSGPQSWGINILRRVQRTGYNDTWTDVRRASASFLLQAGTITGLHDLKRGLVMEAQPFVTASANGVRDQVSGDFTREKFNPEAGVNLRLGLTNLSLDATYNPDFSQVESDASQVTVNERFALFFPEKRPFFLEGIELFSTPNQLVYTRQIVNPILGGKVTGKMGPLGVAYLTAVDEDVDGTNKNAFFNVARVRRDFGSNSVAGLTVTDRSLFESQDYNRVIAGDVRYVFARLYYLEGQIGGSWTRENASTVSSPLWHAEFDRTGRAWGFNYRLDGVGADFQSRTGFVNRNDIVTASAFNRFSWYGGRGAFLENYTVFFGPRRIWRYGDLAGDAIEGGEEVNNSFRFRGGWQARVALNREFVDYEPADYAGYAVGSPGAPQPFVPRSGESGLNGSVSLTTPVFRQIDATVQLSRGRVAIFPEAARGTETRVTSTVNLRPSQSIRVEMRGTLSSILRSKDGTLFARTIIPRLKLEYQPRRALFFRVVGEYVSQLRADLIDPASGDQILIGGSPATGGERNDFRLDLLASFEPTPGTVAFFGYGTLMSSEQTLGFSDLARATDGFFVKLAYQFRR